MNRTRNIVYLILAAIPIAFVLFLLATIHVLYMLLGIVVLLAALVVLKRVRPELFAWMRKEQKPEPQEAIEEAPRTMEPEKVYIVLSEREDFETQRIVVNKASYSIGRSEDNDYVIPSGRISRHHLRIEYSAADDACYAIDLDSANGTSHNNERMVPGRRYRLSQGNLLIIDDRVFTIEYAHY